MSLFGLAGQPLPFYLPQSIAHFAQMALNIEFTACNAQNLAAVRWNHFNALARALAEYRRTVPDIKYEKAPQSRGAFWPWRGQDARSEHRFTIPSCGSCAPDETVSFVAFTLSNSSASYAPF